MMCYKCRARPAKNIYYSNKNGQKEKILLCDECFSELSQEVFGSGNLFTGLFKDSYMSSMPVDKVCKACGTRLSEFNSTGIVGCKNCYSVFAQEIMSAVKKMQGKTTHTGKRPRFSGADR